MLDGPSSFCHVHDDDDVHDGGVRGPLFRMLCTLHLLYGHDGGGVHGRGHDRVHSRGSALLLCVHDRDDDDGGGRLLLDSVFVFILYIE